jgi:Ca-activated chloride channel family protein
MKKQFVILFSFCRITNKDNHPEEGKMKKLLLAILILMLAAIMVLSGCSASMTTATYTAQTHTSSVNTTRQSTTPVWTTTMTTRPVTSTTQAYTTTTGVIGLSAGGAKDITNFRANIQHNYLPLPTDISYEGLFYDYYFDTGMQGTTDKLFNPSYCYAVSKDPISQKTEYYLSFGLNSGIQASDFQRKKLNLVIVLDVSGSMAVDYDQYYYDNNGNKIDVYEGEGITRPNKMNSAATAVASILDQLTPNDRLGIVTFNSTAFLTKPLGSVSQVNLNDIKNRIFDITAGGSTNLDAGLDMGTAQFRNFLEINNYDYENRIIVLTDAEPNTGDTTLSNYMNTIINIANNRIYSTFIGIGVDFNSTLIDSITQVKGANYYSVHSPRQFKQRISDEFEFMVTPLVFNLKMNFQANGWRIEQVFGSPEANQATGELMKINTLFPSKSEGGQNKGGLVLLKLQKTSTQPNEKVTLVVSYEDRNGVKDSSMAVIALEETQPEYFDNSGIRKGILLSRYAALLKNWLIDERQHPQYSSSWNPRVREDTGIGLPPDNLQWERQSLPLTVSAPYRTIFRNFSAYFANEISAIGDNSLNQEQSLLSTLANYR